MPTGVDAAVVSAKAETTAPASSQTGQVAISSTPEGADVLVDGAFVGNTPATLSLASGKHEIRLTLQGYKDWIKELTMTAGSSVKVNSILEAVRGHYSS